MRYQKINIELIVYPEDTDAVVAELNSALDRLDETFTLFGGGIETASVEHQGTRRKSALRHTLEVGNAVASAVKSASQKVADASKKVI